MIPTLSSSAFAGPLLAPKHTGISPIFRGKIELDDGTQIRCFIKPLPDYIQVRPGMVIDNREIVSEALGYVLAKSAGYVVPEHAGIIMLRREQIPGRTLDHLEQITPPGYPQDDYLAWFTEDMRHPDLLRGHISESAPQYLKDLQLRRLAKKLASHPDTPSMVTFDEWTENSDRNLGNIIEMPGKRLGLIDQGRLFRLPAWDPRTLATSPLPLQNVVRDLVDAYTPHWSDLIPVKSSRAMAYNTISVTWRSQGAAAAQCVLSEFLAEPDVQLVIDFLASRLEPAHYNKVVGLLA